LVLSFRHWVAEVMCDMPSYHGVLMQTAVDLQ